MEVEKTAIRRNTLLSGVALIVIFLGEGTFTRLFIVDLSNPQVALYALVVFFLVSIWRYLLVSAHERDKFYWVHTNRWIRSRAFIHETLRSRPALSLESGSNESFFDYARAEGTYIEVAFRQQDETGEQLIQMTAIKGTRARGGPVLGEILFEPTSLYRAVDLLGKVRLARSRVTVMLRAALDDATFFNLYAPHLVVFLVFLSTLPTLLSYL